MKEEETQATSTAATTTTITKKEGLGGGLFGRGKYKLWVLTAIILLALWSMFTGSVTLKWSVGNFSHVTDEFDSTVHDDIDILEVEEKEKMVRHMWDIDTHSSVIKLPSFWQEAFKAAYEDLTSEVPEVRNAAISEIAKMSLRLSLSYDVDFEPPPVESNIRVPKKKEKQLSQLRKKLRQ